MINVNNPPLEGKSTYKSDIDSIIYHQCMKHKESINNVLSGSRKEELVYVRYKIVKQARKRGLTYKEIGRALNRDHSSIVHLDKDYNPPTHLHQQRCL